MNAHEDIYAQDDRTLGDGTGEDGVMFSCAANEVSGFFAFASDMRREETFCDATFVVQGQIFRAHKIVVSSWSRWLFALLSESAKQEVVTLDIFSAPAFGMVLEYMYGRPLYFALENAEPLLKIIRRLELTTVEQKCWKYLMSIVNANNCQFLHHLADLYDCPALKITAWRKVQEAKPGYASAPGEILRKMSNPTRGYNGLTGPGEGMHQTTLEDDESDDDVPSLFTAEGADGRRHVAPHQLPPNAPAIEVIRAWRYRLEEVYSMCRVQEEEKSEVASIPSSQQLPQSRSPAASIPMRQISEVSFASRAGRASSQHLSPARSTMSAPPPVILEHQPSNVSYTSHQEEEEEHGINWRQELTTFYTQQGLPEKIDSIDNILNTWRGREKHMLEVLYAKYEVPFPQALIDKLDELNEDEE